MEISKNRLDQLEREALMYDRSNKAKENIIKSDIKHSKKEIKYYEHELKKAKLHDNYGVMKSLY